VLVANSVVKIHTSAAKALPKLSVTCLQALADVNEKVLANFLTKSLQLLPSYLIEQASRVPKASKPMNCVLAIDIGGTRTKFMLRDGTTNRSLGAKFSKDVWQNEQLPGHDKFDPDHAAERLKSFFELENVDTSKVDGVVVGVPGTVDLTFLSRDEITTVRNMPSFSPKFIGFDFKHAFSSIFDHAKISAIADNMAAGLGVCLSYPKVTSGLVLILGTAPAVATFFRDPSGRDKFIETGIWQTWVWFTKIRLDDPYGYTCGLQITDGGKKIKLKPKTATKIPAPKSRIRFALDNDTWLRLIGKNASLPDSDQAFLSEEKATDVWTSRLQTTVNALALQFHNMYGRPEEIHVLGGNSCRCYGKVTEAKYNIPDTHHDLVSSIPVVIQPNDQAQQTIAMTGLINSVAYKVKKVIASGQDPLARGWKRGGEIYTWTRRSKKREWKSLLRVITLSNSIAKRRASESEPDPNKLFEGADKL
jgi:hypothetical protein